MTQSLPPWLVVQLETCRAILRRFCGREGQGEASTRPSVRNGGSPAICSFCTKDIPMLFNANIAHPIFSSTCFLDFPAAMEIMGTLVVGQTKSKLPLVMLYFRGPHFPTVDIIANLRGLPS